MKKLVYTILLAGILPVLSCSKVIYTQEQVLARYKTKQDVINRFGLPTEKIDGETTETWLYKYVGQSSVTGYANTNVKVMAPGNYRKYVTFLFDKQGNVIRAESTGMDLAEKRDAPGKTVGLVVGIVALASLISLALASSMTFHMAW
jgi:hypothetical protein